MTIWKHILSSTLKNAYANCKIFTHTLCVQITAKYLNNHRFVSVKVHFLIQIYTRADKIAVPLQMLCAWSAHCFVCPTNYQLPTTMPHLACVSLYPSRYIFQECDCYSWSCLCCGFLTRDCYVLVIFLWAHLNWTFAHCMKILRFTNCKNVCATSTFQLVLPSASCLLTSRSLSVRHLLDHSQPDTTTAGT